MVEMRYILRDEPIHQDSQNMTLMQRVKVLQYRRQLPPKMITENRRITGVESQWSDWIDVPTVPDPTL